MTKEVELDSPGKLFQEMLLKLQLPVVERHVLATVAKDLHLEHPAAMLISSVLFDRHVGEWRSDGRGSGVDAKLLAQSRAAAFLNFCRLISARAGRSCDAECALGLILRAPIVEPARIAHDALHERA